MTHDDEIAQARGTLERAVAEYTAVKTTDPYDTYRLMTLKGAIAAADQKLGTLQRKQAAASAEPLRSGGIFYSSDH
jgi:hypothetical protein